MSVCLSVRLILILLLRGTLASDVEDLIISDISDRTVSVGHLEPGNPTAVIGRMFTVTCTITRKKLMKQLGFSETDLFFRFDRKYEYGPVIVPSKYVKIDKSSMMAITLEYPDVDITYHNANIVCLVRINSTSALKIKDQIMYSGYPPAIGHVEEVITYDLLSISVTYSKSHLNPTYPTKFSLYCRFRSMGDSRLGYDGVSDSQNFSECPGQEALSNATIQFQPNLMKGEKLIDNRVPIDVRVVSSSINGGIATGPIYTFNVYEKYKPEQVSGVGVMYTGGLTAVVSWNYENKVPLGLSYTVMCISDRQTTPTIYEVKGRYYESGPFNITLRDLHWATTYNVTITAQPAVGGYPGEPSIMSTFTTADNVPAANPLVTSSGYEREVHGTEQTVILYWEPVPEDQQNGIIQETLLDVIINDQVVEHIHVNQSEASFHQAHIHHLHSNIRYLFGVKIGTSSGINHAINKYISVPPNNLACAAPENITAIASERSVGEVVTVSWTPYTQRDAVIYIHWCLGRHDFYCQGVHKQKAMGPGQHNYTFTDLSEEYSYYKFGVSVEMNTSNSGIHWVNCTYHSSKIPMQPVELRESVPSQRNVDVFIVPGACTVGQGLTYMYNVTLCQSDDLIQCSGTLRSELLYVRSDAKYSITGLSTGTIYLVSVYARSLQGQSMPLQLTLHTLPYKGSQPDMKHIILGVVLCVAAIAVIIIAVFCCRRFNKHLNRPIAIKTAEDHSNDLLDAERYGPDGGYEVDSSLGHKCPAEFTSAGSPPSKKSGKSILLGTAVPCIMELELSGLVVSDSDEYSQDDSVDGSTPITQQLGYAKAGSQRSPKPLHCPGPPKDHRAVMAIQNSDTEDSTQSPNINVPASVLPTVGHATHSGVLPETRTSPEGSRSNLSSNVPVNRNVHHQPSRPESIVSQSDRENIHVPDGDTEMDTYNRVSVQDIAEDESMMQQPTESHGLTVSGCAELPSQGSPDSDISHRSNSNLYNVNSPSPTCLSQMEKMDKPVIMIGSDKQLPTDCVANSIAPIILPDFSDEEEEYSEEEEEDGVMPDNGGYSCGARVFENEPETEPLPVVILPDVYYSRTDSEESETIDDTTHLTQNTDGYSGAAPICPTVILSPNDYDDDDDDEFSDESDEDDNYNMTNNYDDPYAAAINKSDNTQKYPDTYNQGANKPLTSSVLLLDRVDSGIHSAESSPQPQTDTRQLYPSEQSPISDIPPVYATGRTTTSQHSPSII